MAQRIKWRSPECDEIRSRRIAIRRALDRRWHAAGDDRQPFVRMHECRTSYESCDHPVDGADSNISATAVAAEDLIKLVVAVSWLLHAARV
jgi:hypothetical protein